MASSKSGELFHRVTVSAAVLLELRGLLDPAKHAMPTAAQLEAISWLQLTMQGIALLDMSTKENDGVPLPELVIDQFGQIIEV